MNVLGISGSLRKDSFNTCALRAAQELAPPGMFIELADLTGIPVFNEDLEKIQPWPAKVLALRAQVAKADALLFATPEYNYSIPGGLKNAIDWLSRAAPGEPYGTHPLKGKPAAIMGASLGMFGTVRAQNHLRQIFVYLNIHALNQPEVYIGHASQKFDTNGKLTDTATREFIGKLLAALAASCR